MTISISHQAFWDLCQEVKETQQCFDPTDKFSIWKFPTEFGEGWYRSIQLREGLLLLIENSRQYDRMITEIPEWEHPIQYVFNLSGCDQYKDFSVSAGQYGLYGSGLAPRQFIEASTQQPFLEILVDIQPEILRSFVGNSIGELPLALQPLIRPADRENYGRSGITTPMMQSILQQILCCPYQGITRRVYLESKVLELLALLLEQETEIQTGDRPALPLKPGTLARIYYAREVLLQRLSDPPSLTELAKQVKLNEYTLKRGFRQVFGTTVFGYLHNYRLEQARQLLQTGHMKVAEVMQAVGFVDRHYFAAAFRKKFSVNPRDLRKGLS